MQQVDQRIAEVAAQGAQLAVEGPRTGPAPAAEYGSSPGDVNASASAGWRSSSNPSIAAANRSRPRAAVGSAASSAARRPSSARSRGPIRQRAPTSNRISAVFGGRRIEHLEGRDEVGHLRKVDQAPQAHHLDRNLTPHQFGMESSDVTGGPHQHRDLLRLDPFGERSLDLAADPGDLVVPGRQQRGADLGLTTAARQPPGAAAATPGMDRRATVARPGRWPRPGCSRRCGGSPAMSADGPEPSVRPRRGAAKCCGNSSRLATLAPRQP